MILTWTDDAATVEVVDTGGDGTPSGLPSGGYGLAGLAKRAALAGGRLDREPTRDGFRVRLTLPKASGTAANPAREQIDIPARRPGARPMTATPDPTPGSSNPTGAPTRVLIADDQKVVRDGLAMMLGLLDGIDVIGTAVDGADAVRQAIAQRPDVVLMDLNMPTVDGVKATRQLVAAGSPSRVVVLTTYADDEWVFRALQAGARGFLTKDAGADKESGPRSPPSPPATPNWIPRFNGDCWRRSPPERTSGSRPHRPLRRTASPPARQRCSPKSPKACPTARSPPACSSPKPP